MADIAMVFHWPPTILDSMSVAELVHWRGLAVEKWNQVHGAEKS